MLRSPAFAHVDEQQQHLLFMGVDPQRAFGGDRPMFRLRFIAGDAASAARQLAEGRYCVVTDHFSTQTGLRVGDSFSVEVPNDRGRQVRYTIAGITSVPGWNWLTKFSEIRRRAGRALAMVFVGYDQARADFALTRVSFFWMNVADGVTPKELEERIEPVAKRYAGVRVDIPQVGQAAVGSQYVKITDRENVIAMLFRRANDVIWALTWLPLITLAISSLAVFNTILASVRARYWQIGILRGVGLTGSQLLRLILGESVLICGAACILSLASGIGLAWCGTRLCTLFFFFGGHTPPLVLPWGSLSVGFGMAFGVCFLAGLIPAALAARKEPLGFIQAGRLAM
jgi:putative ABC transport system permease protein